MHCNAYLCISAVFVTVHLPFAREWHFVHVFVGASMVDPRSKMNSGETIGTTHQRLLTNVGTNQQSMSTNHWVIGQLIQHLVH